MSVKMRILEEKLVRIRERKMRASAYLSALLKQEDYVAKQVSEEKRQEAVDVKQAEKT